MTRAERAHARLQNVARQVVDLGGMPGREPWSTRFAEAQAELHLASYVYARALVNDPALRASVAKSRRKGKR